MLVLAAAAVLSSIAPGEAPLACSSAPGFRLAEPDRDAGLEPRTRVPMSPSLHVELKRGFDGGDLVPCSDAGRLTFIIDDRGAAPSDAYLFETSGRFPDGLIPKRLIVPVELADGEVGFRFEWLDLAPGADTLAPIDATIGVRSVSVFGRASEPARFRVADPGGKPSPQTYDGAISVMTRLTQIAIALLVPLFAFAYLRQRLAWQRKLREFQAGPASRADVDT